MIAGVPRLEKQPWSIARLGPLRQVNLEETDKLNSRDSAIFESLFHYDWMCPTAVYL